MHLEQMEITEHRINRCRPNYTHRSIWFTALGTGGKYLTSDHPMISIGASYQGGLQKQIALTRSTDDFIGAIAQAVGTVTQEQWKEEEGGNCTHRINR